MEQMNIIRQEDCFDRFEKMEDNSIDHVFTSPPYNRKRNDKYAFYDDRIKDYWGFLKKVIDQSLRVSRKNVFINIAKNYYNKAEVYQIFAEYGEGIQELFIWSKSNPLPASGESITSAYEFVFALGEKLSSNETYTKNHIHTGVAVAEKEHRAVMVKEVADFFIRRFTKQGEVIYDPFMGTGTTAVSAKEHGRIYLGSEIQQEYCDMANEKLRQDYLALGDV
ncbi:MAG: hypothetical protein CMF45_08715 [Legionellales bacterium]|nr:hypothetical protein [Legionellales bacterium]